MDYRSFSIKIDAWEAAPTGGVCATFRAIFLITRIGANMLVHSGEVEGFATLGQAKATALGRAMDWIDEQQATASAISARRVSAGRTNI